MDRGVEIIPSLRWKRQISELLRSLSGPSTNLRNLFGKLILIGFPSFLFLSLPSCNAKEDQIMVFAASSLVEVLAPIGDSFTEQEGVPIVFNFGASDSLAQQIQRGAKADVYLSAGTQPMDTLENEGFILSNTRRNILTNQLVLVSRHDSNLGYNMAEIFASSEISRVAVTDPSLAPAGRYSVTALETIGVWENILEKVIFSPNVRATLSYVESGNADIGIVYRTDATNRNGLQVVFEFPKDSYGPIVYPAAVLKDSINKEVAFHFIRFLSDNKARTEFRDHNFEPIHK